MFSIEGFKATFEYMQLFKEGVVCTISLSALTVFFGFILALILALMRMSKIMPLRALATGYVELFRATPMLVQIMLVYNVFLAPFDRLGKNNKTHGLNAVHAQTAGGFGLAQVNGLNAGPDDFT